MAWKSTPRDVMAERFSASDLCSDGRVIRMWVRILATTVVPGSLSKILYHTFSAPRSTCVPARVDVDIVFEEATEGLRSAWGVSQA